MPTKPIKKQTKKKQPPTIKLDEWEEAVRGDYYDYKKCLNKDHQNALCKLNYWQNYQPSSWIGNWYKNCQVQKLKKKVDHYYEQCNK
jgi:hypothetical protein